MFLYVVFGVLFLLLDKLNNLIEKSIIFKTVERNLLWKRFHILFVQFHFQIDIKTVEWCKAIITQNWVISIYIFVNNFFSHLDYEIDRNMMYLLASCTKDDKTFSI